MLLFCHVNMLKIFKKISYGTLNISILTPKKVMYVTIFFLSVTNFQFSIFIVIPKLLYLNSTILGQKPSTSWVFFSRSWFCYSFSKESYPSILLVFIFTFSRKYILFTQKFAFFYFWLVHLFLKRYVYREVWLMSQFRLQVFLFILYFFFFPFWNVKYQDLLMKLSKYDNMIN